MKRSKVETEETRKRIIAVAVRKFCRDGIQSTAVADVMAGAGLTHGGFYRHFDSKDQLVAEACSTAMSSAANALSSEARRNKSGVVSFIENYLSAKHRDDLGGGCPLAGLGSELVRADEATRTAVTENFAKLVDALAQHSRRRKSVDAKSDAIFILSALVGAVTMSRMVSDEKLSSAILRDTEKHLLGA